MLDGLKDFYDAASIIDLIYLIITIFSLNIIYEKNIRLETKSEY